MTQGSAGKAHSRPSRRKSRALGALAALAIAVVIILVGGYFAWWSAFRRPLVNVEAGRAVTVTVPAGATTGDVAELLARQGVVANPRAFILRAKEADADGALKAGTYELRTGMGYQAAIASLTAGPPPPTDYVTVTIPEGFTVEQIGARLEKQAGIPAEEFLALANGGAGQFSAEHPYLEKAYRSSLEGFLFPKTYRVKDDYSARDVIEMMLDQFDKETASLDLSRAASRGITLPELVTMASIIERETKVAKERPVVSAVIYNRLAQKMRLDMCSTIEYVIKQHKLRLTYADLNVKSPYNTYRHAGLPPGPIASPGLAALKAAAAPADTDYLYYVLTGHDGSHTFATTPAEFARAKAKSKEVFGQ